MRCLSWLIAAWAISASLKHPACSFAADAHWRQWRGPTANGLADADPPIQWDAATNVRWQAPIPGAGSATPIVWEDRIFVLTAIETDVVPAHPPKPHDTAKTTPPDHEYQFVVICLDRTTGDELWQRVAIQEVPHEGLHGTNSYASGSPVTDGERLYASFGSRGIFCFDLDGNEIWDRDLGDMRTRFGWGEAVTPALHGDSLVVNWDHEDQSFIVCLDAVTGDERWRLDRDEPTSWATPCIVEHDGRTQVIVNGTNRVRSYDLENGEVIWECGGQTVNAIPSPLVVGDVAYCTSGYRGAAMFAIPLDAQGDITDSSTPLWSFDRATPYVPSPIVTADRVYFTAQNNGTLTCLDAATGDVIFGPERLPGIDSLYASPIAAANRLYFVSRDGTTLVLQQSDSLDVLAINRLDDPIDASPVALDRQLFLRGASHLYCFEEP